MSQTAVESSEETNKTRSSESSASFVNRGLQKWEKARSEWLSRDASDETDSTSRAAIPLEVDEIIDVLFSPRWRGIAEDDAGPPKAFPQNVPLPQMVDILVDLWEAEGLDP